MSKVYIIYQLKGKGLNLIKDEISPEIYNKSTSYSDMKIHYMVEKGLTWKDLKGDPQLEVTDEEA